MVSLTNRDPPSASGNKTRALLLEPLLIQGILTQHQQTWYLVCRSNYPLFLSFLNSGITGMYYHAQLEFLEIGITLPGFYPDTNRVEMLLLLRINGYQLDIVIRKM